MTRSGRYSRLDEGASGADICPVHRLLNLPRVTALVDTEKLREGAGLDTQQGHAQAQKCAESPGDVWHIFMPKRTGMKAIRKRLRKAGVLPPVAS